MPTKTRPRTGASKPAKPAAKKLSLSEKAAKIPPGTFRGITRLLEPHEQGNKSE